PGSDPEEIGKPYFKIIIEVLEGKMMNFATGDRDLLVKYINPGTVEGISIGTNISVASSLIGTKYMPDTTDKILFAEDTGITAGDIDRIFSP
ncbi:Peptidase S66, LD-carboxypeptidase A, partial [mine drainage metagenome]